MKALHANGAVITTVLIMATGDGIIWDHDSHSLAKNGGPVGITKHWANSIMAQMKYVKRCGSSKAKVTIINLDMQFISIVQAISE